MKTQMHYLQEFQQWSL